MEGAMPPAYVWYEVRIYSHDIFKWCASRMQQHGDQLAILAFLEEL